MVEFSHRLTEFQSEFVRATLALRRPARVVLLAPSGGGKGVAAQELVRELVQKHGKEIRILAVLPAMSLQSFWADVLRHLGISDVAALNAPLYREMEAETPPGGNPWERYSCYVTSVDFLRRGQRLEAALRCHWNVVLFDDVDTAREKTESLGVVKAIWEAPTVDLAIALGTPESIESSNWSLRHTHITRWSRAMYPGARERHIAGRVRTIEVLLSAEELEFLAALRASLSRPTTTGQPVRSRLFRLLASSLYAADQLLQRQIAKLTEPQVAATNQGSPSVALTHEGLGTQGPDLEVPLEECRRLTAMIETIAKDSRWSSLATWFEGQTRSVSDPLVVFTESTDTAAFLSAEMSERGASVQMIVPDVSPDMTDVEGRDVIVAETTATKGLEMPFATRVIHYDVPDSPRLLHVRYTRFALTGFEAGREQQHIFVVDNFVDTYDSVAALHRAARPSADVGPTDPK